MTDAGGWLELTGGPRAEPGLMIHVPKRIVRLATARNRIRRLIRECVRKDEFFRGRAVHLHIRKDPGDKIGLTDVERVVNAQKFLLE